MEKDANNIVKRGQCGENAEYTLDEEETLIVFGRGDTYHYSELSGFAIANDIYREMTIKKVVIKEGISGIGNSFFNGCVDMERVEIPSSVNRIGENAFRRCVSLKNIEIPENVESIQRSSFRYCDKLQAVNVAEDNVAYKSIDGVVYTKDMTEIVLCPSQKEKIVIPETVTRIGDCVFQECRLTEIEIPNSVTRVGRCAFANCKNLTSIKIPGSVRTIGNGAFYDCENLRMVEFSEGVTGIEDDAFTGCISLKSVIVPQSVISIGIEAFGFDNNREKIHDFTLCCYLGSAAESYAIKNGVSYRIEKYRFH